MHFHLHETTILFSTALKHFLLLSESDIPRLSSLLSTCQRQKLFSAGSTVRSDIAYSISIKLNMPAHNIYFGELQKQYKVKLLSCPFL